MDGGADDVTVDGLVILQLVLLLHRSESVTVL